jgi:hypothetical protein
MGGTSSDRVNSIAVDATGTIYTTGYFNGTADFDPGAGTFNLTSSGASDVFISKLDGLGNFVSAQKLGGVALDGSYSIALDASNNIYTAGTFYQTVDFDPGAGIFNLTAKGTPDLFIHKMSQCTLPPANITAAGPTTFCTGGFAILNANTGSGFTYQWKKNGANISGAVNSSYMATAAGSYTVQITNSCGVSTSAATTVTVSTSVPGTPGSITTTGGNVKVCPGDIRTYTVTAVSSVVSYTWIPCAGSIITSGQNTNSVTIQYNSNFPASDTLRVVANNYCGTSAQRKLKIYRNNPGTPGSITGDGYGVCNLSGVPYSVPNVSGMTYNWSFNTGTATVASGQGTSAITANFGAGFISGTISVTATNACTTSTARVKTIYARPATPASITGATTVCVNQQDVPYSIAPLANTVNYTWIGPTGSHISDGINTSVGTTLVTTATSVTVDFATSGGIVKVRGNNACALGAYKSLTVAIVCREGDAPEGNIETSIYPNPAVDMFSIETNSSDQFDLEVYDAYGKLIFTEVSLSSGVEVNTNGWADGIYSVVVRKGNSQEFVKLVLQR